MLKPAFKFSGPNNWKSGFTLIEILVAIFIFTTVSIAIIMTFSNLFTSASKQSGLLADQDQARKLISQITFELRNASAGNNGAYQVNDAENQQLIFFSNADGVASTTERIRYFLQNGKIYKGITKYSGGIYDISKEQSTVVLNNLANGTAPVFYYYGGGYTGSSTESSLVQPVTVSDVKFVKVILQIYDKAGVKQQNTYTISGGATIRSLKDNLGE